MINPNPKLNKVAPSPLEIKLALQKVYALGQEVVDFKKKVEETIESQFQTVDGLSKETKQNIDELKKLTSRIENDFEQLAEEIVDALKDIKSNGLKGDDGKDADEEAIEERLLNKIPKIEDLVKNIPTTDEIVSTVIKQIPQSKPSLKVIQEAIDLEEVTKKVQEKISLDTIKGWDKKWNEIKLEISRSKQGYHGGGFNNIANASGTVSTGLDTLKFTGSGVGSVTQSGRTVTVDIISGGGTGTVTEVETEGLITGGPITTTGTITTSMATNRLVGRSTAGAGIMEEITVGTGLSLSGGTLSSTVTGDVTKVGTPVNNQVAVWTGDGTIEGDANLTFDTSTDTLTTINTIVDTLVVNGGVTQSYLFDNDGNNGLHIKGQTAGTLSEVNLSANDGDNTDNVNFKAFGLGDSGGTNTERLVMGYNAPGTDYRIHTAASGTGSVRPLRLYTGSNTSQVVLNTDGTSTFGGGVTLNTGIVPDANDGAYLGTSSLGFSDLFLAEGAVINWDNGDATLTQSGNTLTVGGAELIIDAASGPTSTSAAGFRGIPQNSQSTAYTTVLTDAGKHIIHPLSDNNARTFTIDSNANVAYPIGTALTFVNMINTLTIAITSDTMYLAGAGTTGSRTLAAYGIATAVKVDTTVWLISGTNLT